MPTLSDPRMERLKRISGTFTLLMWIARRRFFQLLQPFGLTLAQFMSLAALSMQPEAYSMSDLTNVTLHEPATMTGIVDRLVKMGLVERSRSKTDRRVVLVKITPSGVDLLKQIHQELINDSQIAYQILSDEELTELEHVFSHALDQVRRYLSAEGLGLDAGLDNLEAFMCNSLIDATNLPVSSQHTR